MKRKFRALLTFLKPYKEEVKFYWGSYDGRIEWDWTMCNKKEIPDSVKNIALEITESLENEILDNLFDECYSETDHYLLFLIVNPVKKTATIKLETEHTVSQPETYENQLNNPELEEYFKRTGVEIIEARYSGGGDIGDIDKITIDGEDSNIQWSSNDESERLIWNTLYDNLENAYAGWEIDDGSAGTIELNNNQEIVISHEWSIREMDLCDEQIEITMDMLED